MNGSRNVVAVAVASLVLSACAYTTATRVTKSNEVTVKGVRVFAPKAFLVASGAGVSTVVVPDCSEQYAVQFGTVFAKNDVDLDMTNGILTKLGSKQDSTALPLEFIKALTETAKAGKHLGAGLSEKAAGGTNTFTLYSVDCVADPGAPSGKVLRLNALVAGAATAPAVGDLVPAALPGDDGNPGAPLPGGGSQKPKP